MNNDKKSDIKISCRCSKWVEQVKGYGNWYAAAVLRVGVSAALARACACAPSAARLLVVEQTPRARAPPCPASFGPLSYHSVDVLVSFLSLMLVRTKAYYFTSLPSAGAVCEKETFQLMTTRGKSQHVSTSKLYACAHRVSLSSICDTRKWSQHNILKPSDKFALWYRIKSMIALGEHDTHAIISKIRPLIIFLSSIRNNHLPRSNDLINSPLNI